MFTGRNFRKFTHHSVTLYSRYFSRCLGDDPFSAADGHPIVTIIMDSDVVGEAMRPIRRGQYIRLMD